MNSNNEKLDRFISLLEGIFELDKADLDFGIYRILNIRKDEITKFLSDTLPKKVREALTPFAADTKLINTRMSEIEKQAADLEIEISDSPKLFNEYSRLKTLLGYGVDMDALETDVYSALYNFFNRYYDEGDFISKRRYKEGVYAIPYEGEEVKLYWANADQYYIKTAENFRDYSFISQGKKIHFRLVEATTERNNNKESGGNGRVFMLYTETADRPDIKTIEETGGELVIRFVYDLQTEIKGNKIQDKYTEKSYKAISGMIQKSFHDWTLLFAPAPTAGNASRTLLEKHLTAYVAKNTFDYFIHKDLRGFLTRELDFFIKSEVIRLDDIDTADEKRTDGYLAKVRAIKRVGRIIIDFLAQIEDFQKKLWLKKKFVVETNWCITLDRVDEAFYPEIISNVAQIAEWVDMYAIDEINANLVAVGYSDPLTVDFLRQNGNLVLDTKYFSADFKDRLVASIENLDEQTGGVMIHSENFQALGLLTVRYRDQIKCVYIDPPYNTDTAPIMYKNGYKDSSWLSLMESRLKQTISYTFNRSVLVIAVDKVEQAKLSGLLECMFPAHEKTMITVQHNPTGQMGDNFAESNQFAYFVYNRIKDVIGKEYRAIEDSDTRTFRDNSGNSNLRTDAANCFYPIFVKEGKIIGFGNIAPDDYHPAKNVPQSDGTIAVYPIDNNGIEKKWVYERGTVEGILSELWVMTDSSEAVEIMRTKSVFRYKTIWADKRYSDNSWGSALLTDLKLPFSYPKSIYTVIDSVKAAFSDEKYGVAFDYFAGSGTTGHAVLNLNRADDGARKYILVEMGEYFNTVTLPRMKKVVYCTDWRNGKPRNRDSGVSHMIKYFTLESYEDTLANITLDDNKHQLALQFGDEYMVQYMFHYEAKDSMLPIESFSNPFAFQLKINENNETSVKTVDLCETYNYLLGLSVIRQSVVERFSAALDPQGEYENAVVLESDDNGAFSFKHIEGRLPDGRLALIIWRTITEDLLQSNAALDAYFAKHRINQIDREFDVIFVNGDNNLENLRLDGGNWKVERIEPVFKAKMFEET